MSDNAAQVLQEVQKRAHALIAKDASMDENEGVRRVFAADAGLYERYREASAMPPEPTPQAPRLAEPQGIEAEVIKRADRLVSQSPGLSYAEALSDTFRADPALYVAYTRHAGVEPAADIPQSSSPAPVVKVVEHPLAADILALAKVFRPSDPTGEGMVKVRQALGLLKETIERKKRSAA